MIGMTDRTPQRRWFRPTPGWLAVGLLAVEGLLWLSERYEWFGFNSHEGWTALIAVAAVGAMLLLMLLWFAVALIFRLRFQFSIRSLLVLTVAVALPCSWMAVEMKAAREQKEAVDVIEKSGGSVVYDWQDASWGTVGDDGQGFMLHYTPLPDAHPSGPEWLRNLLGDDFFGEVEIVELSETQVADRGLEYIERMNQLQILELGATKVTDAGLKKLQRALPNCKICR